MKNTAEDLIHVLLLTEELVDNEEGKKTLFEALASLTSEVGELAQELLTEAGSYGNRHRTVDEGSTMEAVDVLICGLHMYFATGGELCDLPEKLDQKLEKWAKCQKL